MCLWVVLCLSMCSLTCLDHAMLCRAVPCHAVLCHDLQEKAVRAHHHNIKYYCGVAAPSYEALGLKVNNTQCAHAATLVS